MKGNSSENNKVLAAGLGLKFEIEKDIARSPVNNKVEIEIKEEIDEVEVQKNLRTADNFFTIKSEIDDNVYDVFCSSCNKVFSTSKLLEDHITSDLGCKLNKNLENIKTESDFETLNSEELTLTFFNASNNTPSTIKLELEENLIAFNHLKTLSLQNDRKPEKSHFCECCSKSFSNNTEFSKQKQIHLMEEQQINDLKRKRTEEISHACDVCTKEFSQPSSLKVHKRLQTGEKPYVCESCNKRFAQRSHLKVHRHTHTGEKPYVCEICNKRFIQACSLKLHKRIHTGEQPYVCDICSKRFSQANSLKLHIHTHTGEKPYASDICNKRFSRASNLKLHKYTHTGEKPYICDICSKRFSQESTLNLHKHIHTGEKPYVCNICDRRFTQSSNLTRHKRTHNVKNHTALHHKQ